MLRGRRIETLRNLPTLDYGALDQAKLSWQRSLSEDSCGHPSTAVLSLTERHIGSGYASDRGSVSQN